LAKAARVSLPEIGSFERGLVPPRPETLKAIIGALEAAGIEFTDDAPGARLKKSDG
jgi:predicted transcriptional regulator